MRPVQYIFLNRGAGMSPGKLAAQAAHASVLALKPAIEVAGSFPNYRTSKLVREYFASGHYTKLTMLAEDETHLHSIDRYLADRGYFTVMVIDEGHTEVRPHTATAIGVELVDKDDERIQQHFGDFKLYKEPKPEPIKWNSGRIMPLTSSPPADNVAVSVLNTFNSAPRPGDGPDYHAELSFWRRAQRR